MPHGWRLDTCAGTSFQCCRGFGRLLNCKSIWKPQSTSPALDLLALVAGRITIEQRQGGRNIVCDVASAASLRLRSSTKSVEEGNHKQQPSVANANRTRSVICSGGSWNPLAFELTFSVVYRIISYTSRPVLEESRLCEEGKRCWAISTKLCFENIIQVIQNN